MKNNKNSDIVSPFQRLRELLDGKPPGIGPIIDMTLGEPRHAPPAFVKEVLAEKFELYNKYPPIRPIPELVEAMNGWFDRRYGLGGLFDAATMLLPSIGSREGLFSAAFTAAEMKARARGAALIPNPFYQVYAAGAEAAGLEAVYLDAPRELRFLPDLDRLARDKQLLNRTTVMFLCSPSNPQGAMASEDYLRKAIGLARQYDFMLFSDECYSELYYGAPPVGALQAAAGLSGDFANVVAFNSLSKRSNLPGLRSGFVAGDQDFIKKYTVFRNVSCPQMPLPVQYASAAVWADEEHVKKNRKIYKEKINISVEILEKRFQVEPPAGGFFLWINMSDLGGGEAAAERFWKDCGVKVLPGAYLAKSGSGTREEAHPINPASDDVRIALVHDLETTKEAMERLVSVD